jgi:hypothetical protein
MRELTKNQWFSDQLFDILIVFLRTVIIDQDLFFEYLENQWVYISGNNQWTSFWKSANTGCHRDGVIDGSHVFTQEYVIFAS